MPGDDGGLGDSSDRLGNALDRAGPYANRVRIFDVCETWHGSTLPVQQGRDGITDPAVALDTFVPASLIGEPLKYDRSDFHGHVLARRGIGPC